MTSWTNKLEAELRAIYAFSRGGPRLRRFAKQHGFTMNAVYCRAWALNISRPQLFPVEEIYKRVLAGETQRALAKEFNVSSGNMSTMLKRYRLKYGSRHGAAAHTNPSTK